MADTTCPVCTASIPSDETACGRCGFKLAGSTESFAPVAPEGIGAPPPELMAEEFALLVTKGPQVGAVFYLDTPVVSIGRDPSRDIFLNDMTVSRNHAVVKRVGDGTFIEGQGSLNGTWVDGEIVENARLHLGMTLQIGVFVLSVISG